MKNDNRYVGLDVHAETIAVAVVETDGEVRFLGAIPIPRRDGAAVGEAAGTCEPAAILLRGRADGVRSVLAVDGSGGALRRGGTDAGASEAGGSGEDGPPGRGEAGGAVSGRPSHAGVGAGPGARGAARLGAGTGGGEERPVAGAPPAAEVPVAARASAAAGGQGLDAEASRLGAPGGALRGAGTGGGAGRPSGRGRARP